jgi:lysophospholipase L1-like esterase
MESWAGAQTLARLETEIRAFEKQDSLLPLTQGEIVLWGSSTFKYWKTVHADLAGYPVTNRGFGGSQMEDAILYFDRIVIPRHPKLILIYEGENDLAVGQKAPKRVLDDFKTLLGKIRAQLPETKVAIYSIKPCVKRVDQLPLQQRMNAIFRKYCRKHKRWLSYIDTAGPLLVDGKPTLTYLVADQLHLNEKGYAIWANVTREFLGKNWK